MLRKKMIKLISQVGYTLCKYRGNGFVEFIDDLAYNFHRSLNNRNWNMKNNGERRVLRVLSHFNPHCIFDVGANVGKWSKLVSKRCPESVIHAFELVPATYEQCKENVKDLGKVKLNNFGLSDNAGKIPMNIGKYSSSSTGFKIEGFNFHDEYYSQVVDCEIQKGSMYVLQNSLEQIDFLKIDTEGMDLRVIKGFEDQLHRVKAIQFEYGIFNIASKDLLRDFCSYLAQFDFVVGKIFPRYVKFFDYHWRMENFYGGNFVAVKKTDKNLIDALKGNRGK